VLKGVRETLSGRIIHVEPEDLHLSAGRVDGHLEDVQAGHAEADGEIAAAQAGLVGLSAGAIAAKSAEWKAVTAALSARLAEHSAAFRVDAAGYQDTERANAADVSQLGAQAGFAMGQ
jgi:WXG100 family type VII secretion target